VNFSIEKYNAGKPQIISAKLIADLETPVSAFLKLNQGRQYICLLESVQGGESRGRYSIIALNPDFIFKVNDSSVITQRLQNEQIISTEEREGEPLAVLKQIADEFAFPLDAGLPPMASGLFGYMGYDMVRFMEDIPYNASIQRADIPDSIFMRPLVVIVFDSVADEILLLRLVAPEQDVSAQDALNKALHDIEEIKLKLARQLVGHRASSELLAGDIQYRATNGREKYIEMVAKAKEYIVAGDCFQIVLSESFEADFYTPPFSLYRALRHLNPSPFLVYMSFGEFQLVSSSPEILVRLRNNEVTIRPIAGTRPRGKNTDEDYQLAQELLHDEKEKAEHLMLVDLGRNDVGRVSKAGSVKVTDMMSVENYSHVMHLVSNVTGQLQNNLTALDALIAGFPAGTLSGAPKIRAMEIINQLEGDARGFYGGCIGYIGAGGDMDTCIAIRTALVKDNRIYTRAGAGIVYDSVPDKEYEECLNKARAIFRAASQAERFV